MNNKNLYENKFDFEKDILAILKKYGFKIDNITSFIIKGKIDHLPEIELIYCKQFLTLYHKIERFINYTILKIKMIINNV